MNEQAYLVHNSRVSSFCIIYLYRFYGGKSLMKRVRLNLPDFRTLDYRHCICIAISLVFLGCGFLFPNALPRIGESIRDVVLSLVYYFAELFFPGRHPIYPTVVDMPSWEFAPSPWAPLKIFPYTWEEFKVLWSMYWEAFFSKKNFEEYFTAVGDFMYNLSRVLLIILPLVMILFMKLRGYTEIVPNKRKGKSKQLSCFENFTFKVIYPIVAWIKDFKNFVTENKKYYQLWMTLWLLYFNVISMTVEFIAFYLYFIVSFDFLQIYTQILKLLVDLAPMVRFLPGIVWLLVGMLVYNHVCRSMAFTRLYAYERANRSFLKKRGVVTTVYGAMGTGKTQLVTSMALSAEIEQWDNAFEILLEKDLMFPNFPWQNLRDYLNREICYRGLCDLDAVKARIKTYRRGFEYALSNGLSPSDWRIYRRIKKCPDYTFGYDYEHYAYTYNDEAKITHLYDAIEDYACAYLVFTVRTSLIFANYSIRVDSLLEDLGNMPLRNNDFFHRHPEAQAALSRQCHIINYDMLRLGKRMQRAFKLSFGVFVITEIDKERKNSLELAETKKTVEECNQKNDLFNACLMMCRHAAVISNRVFIRIICDLQRPEAWGAGGRELGEVIYIADKGEMTPVLPFFSPYWLCQGLFLWLKGKWESFHSQYIHIRRDGTLVAWLLDNITNKVNHHYDKVDGRFGAFTLRLELQSGRMDGETKKDHWRIMNIKDRSRRYKTDCLESVFDTYEPNTMHIDDFICYAGAVGTLNENHLQNSYFQNDIKRMHEEAA